MKDLLETYRNYLFLLQTREEYTKSLKPKGNKNEKL